MARPGLVLIAMLIGACRPVSSSIPGQTATTPALGDLSVDVARLFEE